MPTPIIAGSTGLVGSKILSCLSDQNLNPIALARSTIKLLPANAHELIVDYDSLLTEGSLPKCDHVFICLGTTIKIAKSKENFKKVDLDYPLAIAQKALDSGAKKLTLISSVGC
jgi:nucleoside-diphosphate-sugar epimerase